MFWAKRAGNQSESHLPFLLRVSCSRAMAEFDWILLQRGNASTDHLQETLDFYLYAHNNNLLHYNRLLY